MLTRREVILIKLETTYNVDASPGATDAILISNPSWTTEGARMVDRENVKTTLGKDQQLYGGSLRGISFDMEIKGSGTAGTAPEMDAALKACGFDDTIVADTSVTYAPVSTSFDSVTIYYYQDGILHKITGARSNVSINIETGNRGLASFTLTGHDAGTTDEAIIAPTYDGTVPPVALDLSFAIGGYSAVINALSVDLGNAISTPADISATDGYSEVYITSRDVNGSFDPEMTLVATKDWIGDWEGGTTGVLTTGVIGDVAGNRCAVSMPVVYSREIAPGDRDGVRTMDVTYGAAESSGNDEISMAFT